ncbi:MAG: GNAT family N-acetyltransferase [Lachnospiraceae bacterium]|nr:GNAT family N-acetyltransferase [Lachnospiraceae bacterium]
MNTSIRRATKQDVETIAKLAIQMWESHSLEEMAQDFSEEIHQGSSAIFLVFIDEIAVGFAQCGLRHDYVEGTESSPVGYLEGILVEEAYRKKGLAGELLRVCEQWAREQGCTEFASDCELVNEDSLKFHLKMGFKEANRIICFTKKI